MCFRCRPANARGYLTAAVVVDKQKSYLVHIHFLESTLKYFEVLYVLMFEIGAELDAFHGHRAGKQHIHVLTVRGTYTLHQTKRGQFLVILCCTHLSKMFGTYPCRALRFYWIATIGSRSPTAAYHGATNCLTLHLLNTRWRPWLINNIELWTSGMEAKQQIKLSGWSTHSFPHSSDRHSKMLRNWRSFENQSFINVAHCVARLPNNRQ